MNAKTFEPVVTDEMVATLRVDPSYLDELFAHPDFQRQLRAYAAKVARQMVPERQVSVHAGSYWIKAEAFNDCRAATLTAIDEWEKNNAP